MVVFDFKEKSWHVGAMKRLSDILCLWNYKGAADAIGEIWR